MHKYDTSSYFCFPLSFSFALPHETKTLMHRPGPAHTLMREMRKDQPLFLRACSPPTPPPPSLLLVPHAGWTSDAANQVGSKRARGRLAGNQQRAFVSTKVSTSTTKQQKNVQRLHQSKSHHAAVKRDSGTEKKINTVSLRGFGSLLPVPLDCSKSIPGSVSVAPVAMVAPQHTSAAARRRKRGNLLNCRRV